MFIKGLHFVKKSVILYWYSKERRYRDMDMKKILLEDVDDLIFTDDIWTSSER